MKLEDLGKNLRDVRKSKRMTQRELAKRLGVTPPSGWTMGKWWDGCSYQENPPIRGYFGD